MLGLNDSRKCELFELLTRWLGCEEYWPISSMVDDSGGKNRLLFIRDVLLLVDDGFSL